MISSILAFLIRMALLAAATFLFVVLFEHGPENYLQNAQADLQKLLHAASAATSPVPEKSPESGT